jgi:N-acetylglucosamine-6-phosphate deacetylase
MVTANPSRLLGLDVARGHETVRVGAVANLTIFRQASTSSDPKVVATIVAGQLVSGAPV